MANTDFDDIYSRLQQEFSIEDQTEDNIRNWLTFWDTSSHRVKWGLTDSGKQRYKTVTPENMSSGTRELAKKLALPHGVNQGVSALDGQIKRISDTKTLEDVRDRLNSISREIDSLPIKTSRRQFQTVISQLETAITERESKLEPIIQIEGESFTIPTEFKRGRPRAEVSDIVESVAGETVEKIESSTSREEAESVLIPSNLPSRIRSFLESQKERTARGLPSREDQRRLNEF